MHTYAHLHYFGCHFRSVGEEERGGRRGRGRGRERGKCVLCSCRMINYSDLEFPYNTRLLKILNAMITHWRKGRVPVTAERIRYDTRGLGRRFSHLSSRIPAHREWSVCAATSSPPFLMFMMKSNGMKSRRHFVGAKLSARLLRWSRVILQTSLRVFFRLCK